jgi:hypothetical protein
VDLFILALQCRLLAAIFWLHEVALLEERSRSKRRST